MTRERENSEFLVQMKVRATRWAQKLIQDQSSFSAEAKPWLLNKFVQRILSFSNFIQWNCLENDGEEDSNLISSHQLSLSPSLGCFSCLPHPSFHWSEALHSQGEQWHLCRAQAYQEDWGSGGDQTSSTTAPWKKTKKKTAFASFFWTLHHLPTTFQMIKLNHVSLFPCDNGLCEWGIIRMGQQGLSSLFED